MNRVRPSLFPSLFFLFLAVILSFVLSSCSQQPSLPPAPSSSLSPPSTAPPSTVIISPEQGGIAVSVELAQTSEEKAIGLMNRTALPEDQGMLFVYENDEPRVFWMKNTLIPLDMIFINKSLTIVSIQQDAPPCVQDPCAAYSSAAPAAYVLEVNGGFAQRHGIAVGDAVTFILAVT